MCYSKFAYVAYNFFRFSEWLIQYMASELSAIETSAGYNLYRTTTISLAGNDKDL